MVSVVPSTPAYAYTCESQPVAHRAGTFSGTGITVATGVRATIYVPTQGVIQGLTVHSGYYPFSMGDVYMMTPGGGGGFVQAGWYLGKASQLDEVYTPHFFWGENAPAGYLNGEWLRTGPQLSWGNYYTVTIWKNANNTWNVSLQGSLKGTSAFAHTLGSVGFNGETPFQCITMSAFATHSSPPYASLQYAYGTWNYWSGSLFDDPPVYMSYRMDTNTAATVYSIGGGP